MCAHERSSWPNDADAVAIYETLLVASSRSMPSTWPVHEARLRRGAQHLGIDVPDSTMLTEAIADACVAATLPNGCHWWRVRLDLGLAKSPGTDELHSVLEVRARPALSRIRPPAKLRIGPRIRNAADPTAGVKKTAVGPDMLAASQARQAGFDDVLLLDVRGYISEASTSAVLLGMKDGDLMTPGASTAALPSTTVALLRERGRLKINDCEMVVAQLADVRWACLLNAVCGCRPVHQIAEYVLEQPPAEIISLARRLVDDA